MKRLALFLTALLLVMLMGCWDYKEYDAMSLVTAIGVDSRPNQGGLTLTIENINPVEGQSSTTGQSGSTSSSAEKIEHQQAQGRTIEEAIQHLQQSEQYELFFGYVQVLIVGEDFARKDMKKAIQFFDRSSIVRKSTFLLVTPGKASDVLFTLDTHSPGSATKKILGLQAEAHRIGNTFPKRMTDFFKMLDISGIEPVAPRITVKNNRVQDGMGNLGKTNNTENPEEMNGKYELSQMGAFQNDKFIGWLNEEESRGLGWISNKQNTSYITILAGSSSEEEKNLLSFRISRAKCKTKIKLDGNNVSVYLTIEAESSLNDSLANINLTEPDSIRVIEKKLASRIQSDVEAALKKAQRELHSDIFGFGFKLFRQHSKEWNRTYEKKWPELFPKVPVYTDVEVKVSNIGITNKMIRIR